MTIDQNKFSLDGLEININSKDLKVHGHLKLKNLLPIKRSVISPNIMGFFSYLPLMECNHGLISMNHDLVGQLEVNEEIIDFTGGKGYLEKDWGKSFPMSYTWIQSNHFEDETTAFFCSVARIPMMSLSFTGFICNLSHQGIEYRFATYNGSKLIVHDASDDQVHLSLKNKAYSLEIKGEIILSKNLLAPKLGSMSQLIKEGLSGSVDILLKDKDEKIILSSKSQRCGMELVKMLKPKG